MRYLSVLAIGAAAAVLSGCASVPTGGTPVRMMQAANRIQPEPLGESAEVHYRILAAEMALQRGLRERAAREYAAALSHSDDPDLARRATRVALFADMPELAYRAARVWAAGMPESVGAHRTAARLALAHGTMQALRQYAARALALDPGGLATGFRNLVRVLGGKPEYAERALAVMQDLVAAHPDLAAAHYSLALLAIRYQAFEQSRAAIQRALALRPDWRDAKLLRAVMLVRQGRTGAAREWIADLEGTRVEQSRYQFAFGRLLLDAGMEQQAMKAFERALVLDADNTAARYALAVVALNLGRLERAEQALTTLYRSGKRRNTAAFYLAGIAAQREKPGAARRWYQRVDGGAHAFDARVRAAVMRFRAGHLAAARDQLQSLRQSHRGRAARLYAVEGQILYRAGHLEAALALYTRALEQLPRNPDLLYGRSLVYERLGAFDKAAADLRTILEVKPGSPRALNALGYMLTNHSSRYREALGYIRRALEARPGDPAVMDSMGWVHYRMGNLHKAREFLRRAYRKLPQPAIAAHYGEVLWKLGHKQRARQIWQKALAKAPNNSLLRATVQRLTSKSQ